MNTSNLLSQYVDVIMRMPGGWRSACHCLDANPQGKGQSQAPNRCPFAHGVTRRIRMKPRALQMLAATAAFLLSAFAAFNAAATSVIALDLDQIVAAAQHIVHVRCTGNEVRPDAAVGVVTLTTFVVLDRAKGAGTSTF